MSLEAFVGRWAQTHQENFEEYMKEVGVGLITRKAAANLKCMGVQGKTVTWRQESTLKNHELTFTVGEEFDEETPDGRHFKSIINWDGNKLVQKQTPIKSSDKPSTITRWVEGNAIHIKMESGSVVAQRVYTKQ